MTTKFPCGHDSLTSEYCANCNAAYHLGQDIRYTLQKDNDRLLRAVAGLSDEERGKLRELVVQQPTATPEEVARDVERLTLALDVCARLIAGESVDSVTSDAIRCGDVKAHLGHLAAQATRVPGLEERLTAVADERDDALAQRDAALEMNRTSESERDAAQKEAHRLSNALALEQATRDSAVQDAATLRERVATLEREKTSLNRVVARDAPLGQQVKALRARVKELEAAIAERRARAATREARVNELEELAASLESDVKAYKTRTQHLESAIQAKADDYRASHGEDAEGPHPLVDWADRVLRGASQPPPAPARGLEPLRAALERANDARQQIHDWDQQGPTDGGLRDDGAQAFTALGTALGEAFSALRAAYNATGGESTVLCPGCKQQAPTTEMHARCTMCAAYEDERTKSATLEASPDAEDAAKYRAAVEMAKDKEGMARALYSAVRGKTMRWEDATGTVQYDAEEAAVAVAEHLLTLDTPPSGPGGGERKTTRIDLTPEKMQAVNALLDTIAPTPTPEVPPMERVPAVPLTPEAQAKAKETLTALRKRTCRLCKGDERAHCPECGPGPYPIADVLKPSTPAVVLESGGVQVMEDGSVTLASGTTEWWALGVLGNALAEAKRETAHAQGLLDVFARALSQAVRHAAQLGAEEMRAQVAEFVLDVSIPIPIDFWRGTKKGLVAEFARRLSERVLTLPILGKAVSRG